MINSNQIIPEDQACSLQLTRLSQGGRIVQPKSSALKFVRPLSVLVTKMKKMNPIICKPDLITSRDLLPIYYGKKFLLIRSRGDLVRLYHKSKYFRHLKVEIRTAEKNQRVTEVIDYYAPPLKQNKLVFEKGSIMSTCLIYVDSHFFERRVSAEQKKIIPPNNRMLASRLAGSTSGIKALNLKTDLNALKRCVGLLEGLKSLENIHSFLSLISVRRIERRKSMRLD